MTKKTKQAEKYFFLGLLNTAIGYAIYEILALTVFRGEGQLQYATLVSGVIGIFTGYYIHSRYTWRERGFGKQQAFRFLIWNVIMGAALKPQFTALFEKPVFLYDFAFDIFQAIHIPFSYDFVRCTGNFVLVTALVMIINFLIYDRFVFVEKRGIKEEEDKDGERSESQRKMKE